MQTRMKVMSMSGASRTLLRCFYGPRWVIQEEAFVWSVSFITEKLCNSIMVFLDFLAALSISFQTCMMPCWPGGSDYGPPEVEVDDMSKGLSSRKGQLLTIKESLNVKNFVKSTSHDHHGCMVCLSEFFDEEIVYELPECKHIFHQPCLNQWLRHRRTKCPLCRSSLQPAPAAEIRITGERHGHQLLT